MRHMHKKAAPILILVIMLIACQMPVALEKTPEMVQAPSDPPATSSPRATITRTPFQPLAPTITPSVTPTPTITPTPIPPTPTSTPKTPTLVPLKKLPEEQVRLLILGSDERPGGGYRTDVMALVIINPRQGTASVVSFPRDLWVLIPGWGYERLNTAMFHGFESMAATFESNFGVRPDYYVMTNFSGFTGIIDALGGIDVKVKAELHDKCDLAIADGAGVCHIEVATVPMDGATALWYVRSRYSTSDFDRQRRAQEVLAAILTRLLSLNAVLKGPQLYKKFKDSVDTNVSGDTIFELLGAAPWLAKKGHVSRYTLSPSEAIPVVIGGGAQVLMPNYPAIQAIVQQALQP